MLSVTYLVPVHTQEGVGPREKLLQEAPMRGEDERGVYETPSPPPPSEVSYNNKKDQTQQAWWPGWFRAGGAGGGETATCTPLQLGADRHCLPGGTVPGSKLTNAVASARRSHAQEFALRSHEKGTHRRGPDVLITVKRWGNLASRGRWADYTAAL